MSYILDPKDILFFFYLCMNKMLYLIQCFASMLLNWTPYGTSLASFEIRCLVGCLRSVKFMKIV